MTSKHTAPAGLPGWLTEAIEEGEPLESIPNKRNDDRLVSALYCLVEQDGVSSDTLSAQVSNVSVHGLGMITRKPIPPGQRIHISPGDGSDGDAVEALVAHCTQTVQGYKVGCTFTSRLS